MALVVANGVAASMVILLAIAAGTVLVVGGSAVWLAVVRGRWLLGLVGISAALIAYFVAQFPLTLSLTALAVAVVFLPARPDSRWARRKEVDPADRDRSFFFPPVALVMVAVSLVIMATILMRYG